MNGVNLIPRHRVEARHRGQRVRGWAIGAGATALVLAAGYGLLHARWGGDASGMVSESEALSQKISSTKTAITTVFTAVGAARAEAEAARAFTDRPDWGLMLSLVASTLGQDAALDSCRLEPIGPGSDAKAPKAAGAISGRPSRFTLQLSGFARSQDRASQVALDLKNTGLFQDVVLVEAKRAAFMGTDAVAFQVRCAIVDSSGERP